MDKVLFHIKDNIIHKQLVLDSAYILCEYLFSINKQELGLQLIQRAVEHDNSKFNNNELFDISDIKDDFKNFKNPEQLLSENDQEKIKEHWKNNRHHPEHFSNIENMEELDILEMICDWDARSKQHNTNLIDFVKVRQNNRFHFPQKMFEKILNYCYIITNFKNKLN